MTPLSQLTGDQTALLPEGSLDDSDDGSGESSFASKPHTRSPLIADSSCLAQQVFELDANGRFVPVLTQTERTSRN
jgi:hypothetical protein